MCFIYCIVPFKQLLNKVNYLLCACNLCFCCIIILVLLEWFFGLDYFYIYTEQRHTLNAFRCAFIVQKNTIFKVFPLKYCDVKIT